MGLGLSILKCLFALVRFNVCSSHNCSGLVSLTKQENSVISDAEYWVFTLVVDAGWRFKLTPSLNSDNGRIGLGEKPPPQFGQTFINTRLTQSEQNVHS